VGRVIPEHPEKQNLQYSLAQDERRIHCHARTELLGTHKQVILIYVENKIIQVQPE
jgi:hypothetical protein